jgi:hypothetical protein
MAVEQKTSRTRSRNRSTKKEPVRRKGRDYQVFVTRSFTNQVDPKSALMAAGLAHYKKIKQTG